VVLWHTDVLDSLAGLALNVALLLSLTLLYGVTRPTWLRAPAGVRPLLAGVLFGLIAIAGMHVPIVIVPGVIADARAIPVVLAGPFGGPAAAIIAGLMAAAHRLFLGGVGAFAGVGTIVTASALGVAAGWRYQHRLHALGVRELLVIGVLLDAVMLVWAPALPGPALAREVLGAAAIPVGVFLPLATVALGMLLVNEVRREDERQRLTVTQFALDHTAEALLWIDAGGRIVNANPAAEHLTGHPRADMLAMHIWDVEIGTTPEQWRRFWIEAGRRRSVSAEGRYRRRDGSEVPVETSSDFVEYRGHQWINVFVRDVTERRQAEEERTAHLAREQSLRARAEEANLLKDQFLATISHELRTPLTSILGYAHLLRSGTLHGAAATRAIEVIERNSRAQARLVDDLLDVSRIMNGKLGIERRVVPLVAVIRAEVEAARPHAESRDLALEFVVDGQPPAVHGDGDRLAQVVRNLLSNALKFTPPGGAVSVRLQQHDREAHIVVTDTGRGISPGFLPHVFDRFRQADSSMTRAYEGLGLGLAIVRHLVELHGGRVHAASAGEGCGATFTVILPAIVRTPADPPPRRPTPGDGLPCLDGVDVLVVEDHAETRDLVASLLGRCGAAVTVASSVEDALAAFERARPDVVVSDIAMPGGDGYELVRRLRLLAPDRGGATPVAALTASAGRDNVERALAAGFQAHVAKPFQPTELAWVVATLTGSRVA
jgi:PAS domain S-box-containing protein